MPEIKCSFIHSFINYEATQRLSCKYTSAELTQFDERARGDDVKGYLTVSLLRVNDNGNILFSVHLSQVMIMNCTHTVHVHYANFAVIILMNLTNFNNILTSRLLNSLRSLSVRVQIKLKLLLRKASIPLISPSTNTSYFYYFFLA